MNREIIREDEDTIVYRDTYRTHPDRIGGVLVFVSKSAIEGFKREMIENYRKHIAARPEGE